MTHQLLFCQQRPPYPLLLGGAARITHRLLTELTQRRLFECRWFGGFCETPVLDDRTDWPELGIRSVTSNDMRVRLDLGYKCVASKQVSKDLQSLFQQDPSRIVCTQLENATRVARVAADLDKCVFVFLVDAEFDDSDFRALDDPRIQFVCLSKFLVEEFFQRTGKRAHLLYPIIDPPSQFTPRSLPTQADPEVLMINPHPQKGVETVFAIARQMPSVRFHLVESWPIGPKLRDWIGRQQQQVSNVLFSRRQANVDQIYQRSTLLIVPSKWKEGFGMVAIEAQRHGVPVIASDRGGLPESVGTGGILVEDNGNPDAWVDSIGGLIEDPDRYRRLSEATRHSVGRREFQADSVVEQFLSIVDQPSSSTQARVTLNERPAQDGVFDFIQIGSHVGMTRNDPIFQRIRQGQRGILVEPVPALFKQLVHNYRDRAEQLVFVNQAVTTHCGTLKLYVPSPDNDFSQLPFWASQLASTEPNHIHDHIPDMKTEELDVPCTTLNQLIQDHAVHELNTLLVDTEGHDVAILRSLDLDLLRPRRIQFENKHADGTNQRGENYRKLIEHFANHGYAIEQEDQVNTTLVSKSDDARGS